MSTETSTRMSGSIAALAAAMAKAQGDIRGAVKDAANPFFKSSYADLQSVWDACREPLTKNGLAIVQFPLNSSDGKIGVETLVTHASGEWMANTVFVKPVKDDPQAAGSAITYLRRYALQSVAGVAPVDDDGEGAMGRETKTEKKSTAPAQSAPREVAITAASKKKLEDFRKTELGEKYTLELLTHWKLVDFSQITETEAQEAISWIHMAITSHKKPAA